MMVAVEELLANWMNEADLLSRRGDQRGAVLIGQLASELTDALAADRSQLVSVTEAAEMSGYHPAHIRRLIKEGKLEDLGPGRRKAVRVEDLPRKPSSRGRQLNPDSDVLFSTIVATKGLEVTHG